jgi:hypothetical protein
LEGLPKGGDAEQASDADGGSSTGAPPRVALLGYSDPTGFSILTQDILLKKSPYAVGFVEYLIGIWLEKIEPYSLDAAITPVCSLGFSSRE